MKRIKELVSVQDKVSLNKELPRIRELEDTHKKIIQDLLHKGCTSTFLSKELETWFEIEGLHKRTIEILEPN